MDILNQPGLRVESQPSGQPILNMPNSQDTPKDSQAQLDPSVVNLAKSIRSVEGGNYNASNTDAGGWSVGAYQWHGNNEQTARAHFQNNARSVGLNPDDFSPYNQDMVAYYTFKREKDAGLHADEIAAKHNGAHIAIIDGRKTYVANNPAYIQKVLNAYNQLDKGSPEITTASAPNNTTPGLGSLPSADQFLSSLPQIQVPQEQQTQSKPSVPQSMIAPNMALGQLKSFGGALKELGSMGQSILDQTIGRGINAIEGKGFTKPQGNEAVNQQVDKLLEPSNAPQQVGNILTDIGQFFIPGGQEEAAANIATKFPKLAEEAPLLLKLIQAGVKGGIGGVKDATLAKAQGQSGGASAAIGGLSAISPFIGLGTKSKTIADFFGGNGTAESLAVKNSNPALFKAWETGSRDVNDLAGSIRNGVQEYETQGRNAWNAFKNTLPDIPMPQNFVEGGIKKSLQGMIDEAPNLTDQEIRTLSNLQKYVNRAKVSGIKGILDLRNGIDNAGFFRYGEEYKNSNKIISAFRKTLNDAAVFQAQHYDSLNGTDFASQIEKGLSDAADRINFLDKFKSNFIGTNPDTYVERTINKLKPIIKKIASPGELENTKDLLSEFEQRLGQPGLFSNEFRAANAAQNLKGVVGRSLWKGIKYGALPTGLLTGGGLIGDLVRHKLEGQ